MGDMRCSFTGSGRLRHVGLLSLCGCAVVACGSSPSPPPPVDANCTKVAVHVALHVDATHLWGTDYDNNDRTVSVLPRPDVHWAYASGPPSRIVDESGREVGLDGDIFYQACVDPATNALVIGPEDLPKLEPGA